MQLVSTPDSGICPAYPTFSVPSVTRPYLVSMLLTVGLLSSSCVALHQLRSWHYTLPPTPGDASQLYVDIQLEKQTFPLLTPLIAWEVSTSKEYVLTLDLHTRTPRYQRLDSLHYELQRADQSVGSGTLALAQGALGKRSYSPEIYRLQCSLPLHKSLLATQRQAVRGTFRLYLLDTRNQPTQLALEQVPLQYRKAKISFWDR